jgi:glycosyltransferase involved in cell wall biosynthesis
MNIAFCVNSPKVRLGSETHRGRWPALWINKYTQHNAAWFSSDELRETGCIDVLKKFDVVVFHKQEAANRRAAQWLAKYSPDTVIVFDTDDYEGKLWPEYLFNAWLYSVETRPSHVMPEADGYTVASAPLGDLYSDVGITRVIENAFDVNHRAYRPARQEYFNDRLKIVWGGGASHQRDMALMMSLGIFETILSAFDADFWIYGLWPENRRRKIGRGEVLGAPGAPHDTYMPQYFADASVMFAPLVQDEFNGCRSTLKLVEAGCCGKTIVASRTPSYEAYKGADAVFLVDNDHDSWCDVLSDLLRDEELREQYGRMNYDAVMTHYTAEIVTDQRIRFYEQLREMKCTR